MKGSEKRGRKKISRNNSTRLSVKRVVTKCGSTAWLTIILKVDRRKEFKKGMNKWKEGRNVEKSKKERRRRKVKKKRSKE